MVAQQGSFYWGMNVTVLFYEWDVQDLEWYIAACCGAFLVAFLYEFLISFRVAFESRRTQVQVRVNHADTLPVNAEGGRDPVSAPSLREAVPVLFVLPRRDMVKDILHYAKGALLHMFQLTLFYALVLVVLTFNGGLFISVVSGAGVGYFCFGFLRRPQDH